MAVRLDVLVSSLDSALTGFDGNVSLVIAHESLSYEFKSDTIHPSASIIKLPILLTALREVELGRANLSEVFDLPRRQVGGSTLIEFFHPSTRLTLHDLLLCMMAISDNYATNLVIERFGMERVNFHMSKLGLRNTHLARFMMDLAARRAGIENTTSASDISLLLQQLVEPTLLSPKTAHLAVDILQKQMFETGFGYYLPEGITAHKTGSLEGVFHDVGLLLREGRRPLAFAYLSSEVASIPSSQLLAAEVGKMVFDFLQRGEKI